jgi:uncharacterized BrkB/YihY/UPF0761 family membrane protein
MNSIKALVSGIIFIIVSILTLQLAYLLITVGFNNLAKTYPALNEIPGVLSYFIVIPVVLLIMYTGGYLTAIISKQKNNSGVAHSFLVGAVTVSIMMWMAVENAELTAKGILISILMLVATLIGGVKGERD